MLMKNDTLHTFGTVPFGVILFPSVVPRTSAFLLRVDNYLAFVNCLRRGVGSLRLQFCSAVTVLLRPCMLFHLVYVAWSFAAGSTNKFNKAFIRSHQALLQLSKNINIFVDSKLVDKNCLWRRRLFVNNKCAEASVEIVFLGNEFVWNH